jgi:plastocyanin
MIDIAPPEGNFPRRIPPRELIKQKISEEESGGLKAQTEKAKISSAQPLPSSKKKRNIGIILVFVFLFFIVFGLLGGVGFLYLQLSSQGSKIQELSQTLVQAPSDFETQMAKLENLEKSLDDLKKAEAEKINSLEEKINKISKAPTETASKESVEQLEKILKLTDTDSDGLSDYDEVVVYGTNPNLKDTDGDKYSDKLEIDNGYNPKGLGKLEKTISEIQEVIPIKAFNFAFDPAEFEVKVNENIKLEITNQDQTDHTFTIDELNINQIIAAGKKEIVEFTPTIPGEYVYYSNVIEDKGKGMTGKITAK